jgi:phage baseplate assembly protein gpV
VAHLGEFNINIEHDNLPGTMKAVHFRLENPEIEVLGFRVNGKMTIKKTVTLKGTDTVELVVNLKDLSYSE